MFLPGLLVDLGTPLADFDGMAAMALLGRHELDAAVTVLVVIPIHERRHPLAGFRLAAKWPAWVAGPVLDRTKQGFRVGIVVRNPWPGERAQHPQLLQPGLERGGTHGIAVVGMEDQRLVGGLVGGESLVVPKACSPERKAKVSIQAISGRQLHQAESTNHTAQAPCSVHT